MSSSSTFDTRLSWAIMLCSTALCSPSRMELSSSAAPPAPPIGRGFEWVCTRKAVSENLATALTPAGYPAPHSQQQPCSSFVFHIQVQVACNRSMILGSRERGTLAQSAISTTSMPMTFGRVRKLSWLIFSRHTIKLFLESTTGTHTRVSIMSLGSEPLR